MRYYPYFILVSDSASQQAAIDNGMNDFVPKPVDAALLDEKDMDKAVGLGDERMMRIGVVGDPKQLLERLEPLVAAGVTHLSFGPPLGPDPETAVRMLGEKVLPHFA